jgi:hypothetical protein
MLNACTMPKKLSTSIQTITWHTREGDEIPFGTVVVGDDDRSAVRSGLYPKSRQDPGICCWLSPNATVQTLKNAQADRVHIRMLVPTFPFFKAGQTVTVIVGSIKTQPQNLMPGIHILSATLPQQLRNYTGHVPLKIRSSRNFVPVREGVNSDTRSLGIMLIGVTFS